MATKIPVTSLTSFSDYAKGVLDRANHHGHNINIVLPAVIGAIVGQADPVSFRKSLNVLWWTSASTGWKYACSYNRHTQEIEIRENNIQGVTILKFSNATPVAQINQAIGAL